MALNPWIRDTGWLLLAGAGAAPLQFAASVLLARWLDADAHGIVLAAGATVATAATLAQGGMVSALIDAVRRHDVPPGVAWSRAVRDLAPIAIVVAVPMAFLVPGMLAPWTIAWFVGLLLFQLGSAVDRAADRFREAATMQWVAAALRVGALALALLLGAASAPRAVAASAIAAIGAAVWANGRVRPAPPGPRADAAPMRRFARQSFWWTAGALLHERLDILVLAALAPPRDVAIYGVAATLAGRVRVVPLAAGGALHPHLAGLAPAAALAEGARALRLNALPVVLGAVVLAALAPVVPHLWGSDYGASVPVLWCLLPGAALTGLTTLSGRVLQALDRQRLTVAAQFASLVVGIGLAAGLAPAFGALGVALASTVGAAAGATIVAIGWPRNG